MVKFCLLVCLTRDSSRLRWRNARSNWLDDRKKIHNALGVRVRGGEHFHRHFLVQFCNTPPSPSPQSNSEFHVQLQTAIAALFNVNGQRAKRAQNYPKKLRLHFKGKLWFILSKVFSWQRCSKKQKLCKNCFVSTLSGPVCASLEDFLAKRMYHIEIWSRDFWGSEFWGINSRLFASWIFNIENSDQVVT